MRAQFYRKNAMKRIQLYENEKKLMQHINEQPLKNTSIEYKLEQLKKDFVHNIDLQTNNLTIPVHRNNIKQRENAHKIKNWIQKEPYFMKQQNTENNSQKTNIKRIISPKMITRVSQLQQQRIHKIINEQNQEYQQLQHTQDSLDIHQYNQIDLLFDDLQVSSTSKPRKRQLLTIQKTSQQSTKSNKIHGENKQNSRNINQLNEIKQQNETIQSNQSVQIPQQIQKVNSTFQHSQNNNASDSDGIAGLNVEFPPDEEQTENTKEQPTNSESVLQVQMESNNQTPKIVSMTNNLNILDVLVQTQPEVMQDQVKDMKQSYQHIQLHKEQSIKENDDPILNQQTNEQNCIQQQVIEQKNNQYDEIQEQVQNEQQIEVNQVGNKPETLNDVKQNTVINVDNDTNLQNLKLDEEKASYEEEEESEEDEIQQNAEQNNQELTNTIQQDLYESKCAHKIDQILSENNQDINIDSCQKCQDNIAQVDTNNEVQQQYENIDLQLNQLKCNFQTTEIATAREELEIDNKLKASSSILNHNASNLHTCIQEQTDNNFQSKINKILTWGIDMSEQIEEEDENENERIQFAQHSMSENTERQITSNIDV